jgi:hypothetical protein
MATRTRRADMDAFKNFVVTGLTWILFVLVVWAAASPAGVGEWLAKVEQARQDSMDAYWCQEHVCSEELNGFGK